MNDLFILDEALNILNGYESIDYLFCTFTNEYIEFKSIVGDTIVFENVNIKEKFNKIVKTVKEKIRKLFEKFVKIIKYIKTKVKETISNIKYKLKFPKYDEFEDDWIEEFDEFEDEFFEDKVPVGVDFKVTDNGVDYKYNLLYSLSKHGFGFMGSVLANIEKGEYDEAKDITNKFIDVCKSIEVIPKYVDGTGDWEKDEKIAQETIDEVEGYINWLDGRVNYIEKDIKEYEKFEKDFRKTNDQWEIDNIKAWQIGGTGLIEEMNMCIRISKDLYNIINSCSTFCVNLNYEILKRKPVSNK